MLADFIRHIGRIFVSILDPIFLLLSLPVCDLLTGANGWDLRNAFCIENICEMTVQYKD